VVGAARIGAVIRMVNRCCRVEDYKYYLDYTRRARKPLGSPSQLKTFNEATADAEHLRAVLVVGGPRHASTDVDFTKRGVALGVIRWRRA